MQKLSLPGGPGLIDAGLLRGVIDSTNSVSGEQVMGSFDHLISPPARSLVCQTTVDVPDAGSRNCFLVIRFPSQLIAGKRSRIQ
jgi:hypothetical protein